MLLTALKPIATLENSLEANYDTTRTDTTRTKRLIGARATPLPKKRIELQKKWKRDSASQ